MKGTSEGRRLFAGCAAGGAAVGVLAAVGAGYAFRHSRTFELCGPLHQDVCRRLDIAGFEMRSSWSAAATVGPIVAFLAFLTIVVVVLCTVDPKNR
jgi:hypothetical protein